MYVAGTSNGSSSTPQLIDGRRIYQFESERVGLFRSLFMGMPKYFQMTLRSSTEVH